MYLIVEKELGPSIGSLFISLSFTTAESSSVLLYEFAYNRLVYMPRRHVHCGDTPNTKTIQGEQKHALLTCFSMFHAWCESARMVCLLSKTIRAKRNDKSYIYSMILSFVLNCFNRIGISKSFCGLLAGYYNRLKLLPTLCSRLHDDIKYAVGYVRLWNIIAIILARGCISGNWNTFQKNAYYQDNNGNVNIPQNNKTIQHSFMVYDVYCWNENTLYCLIIIIILEIIEDKLVYFLTNFKDFSLKLYIYVFGKVTRDLQSGSLSKYPLSNGYGDVYHPYTLYNWYKINTTLYHHRTRMDSMIDDKSVKWKR